MNNKLYTMLFIHCCDFYVFICNYLSRAHALTCTFACNETGEENLVNHFLLASAQQNGPAR